MSPEPGTDVLGNTSSDCQKSHRRSCPEHFRAGVINVGLRSEKHASMLWLKAIRSQIFGGLSRHSPAVQIQAMICRKKNHSAA
jgi:hypothetical protein